MSLFFSPMNMQLGRSSLLLASYGGHVAVVRELVRRGAYVNTKDEVSLQAWWKHSKIGPANDWQ